MTNEPWRTPRWYVSPWNYIPEVTKDWAFAPQIRIHDITLRDGEQQAGIAFNKDDKIRIAEKLAETGVHRIEAGMIQLTRCLALEWAPHVRVNAIAPGYLETPLVKGAMKDTAWFERMRNLHAMKRFGRPEEVVGAAIFLASDASTFVTGAVLSVDGGWTAGQG